METGRTGEYTGNIILHIGQDAMEFAPKDHQPGRPAFTLKPDLDPVEWPKECKDLIEDPANKLKVINHIGTDYLLVNIADGDMQTWIDRFNAIDGVSAHAETMARLLA